MKAFFNTLFHGDGKTKLLLWGCVAAVAAAIAFLVIFINTLNLPWLIATVIAILTPLVIMRLYDFDDKMNEEKNRIGEAEQKHEDIQKIREKTAEKHKKADEKPVQNTQKPEKQPKDAGALPEGVLKKSESSGSGLRKEKDEKPEGSNQGQPVSEKQKPLREKETDGVPEAAAQEKKSPQEGEKGSPEKAQLKEKKSKLINADNRSLKQLMHKYKVKREHRPIIIDSSVSFGVEHCPAYMWINRGRVHFLLMEESPREISIDKSKAQEISYTREAGDAVKDYVAVRSNALLTQIFGDFIPSYREESVNRHRESLKNLYIIGKDIKISNTSARAAFDLLKAAFVLPEKYALTGFVGSYTQEAHKIKLLWQDGVINTSEFKSRTKALLQGMADAKISAQEYDRNLREMVDKQLITREYANYYADVRK